MIMNNEGKYGYLFMQDLKLPSTHSAPERMASYAKFGRRIHWVDGQNIPGAFQMNTSWWYKPNREQMIASQGGVSKPHRHAQPEILGFYGSDPENPYELNGEIEFAIDGETHILTKSTMVFLPPEMPHCPLLVNRVDRPIFHFSVIMNDLYAFSDRDFVAR